MKDETREAILHQVRERLLFLGLVCKKMCEAETMEAQFYYPIVAVECNKVETILQCYLDNIGETNNE